MDKVLQLTTIKFEVIKGVAKLYEDLVKNNGEKFTRNI